MHLTRERLRHLDIGIPPDASNVLRFAAAELCHYLQAMGRVPLAPTVDPQLHGSRLRVGKAPVAEAPREPDAFVVLPGAEGVLMAGKSDPALLYAVYRLLESLGCRWSFHGSSAETISPLPREGVPVRALAAHPRFQVRAYASDIHTWHYHDPDKLRARSPADIAFADWMGKTGANGFLFIRHPFDSQFTIPALLPEFSKRGITPEYGGHIIPLLLPRETSGEHPDYFPVDQTGKRTDLGNACTTNPDGMRVVAENAVRAAREHPEMGGLHVWGADLWGGGWCHCSQCARLTVQDQSLRTCNAVARALRAAGLARPVCYLAYHDTIEPQLTVSPEAEVFAEFAPRERCYGHALDDPACHINRRYREAFEGYVEHFDGRVRVFEYYGDSILFCGCTVPLRGVIEADLAYYHRACAREISLLQFGAYSLWAHPLNFIAFAAATWGDDPAAAIEEYGGGLVSPAIASRYWQELEAAMAAVVTYGDIRRPPQTRAPVLLPQIAAARSTLRRLRQHLAAGTDPFAQAALLEYTETVLHGVEMELSGAADARERARACYDRALLQVSTVDPRHLGVWGAFDLPMIHAFYTAKAAES